MCALGYVTGPATRVTAMASTIVKQRLQPQELTLEPVLVPDHLEVLVCGQ